MGNYKWPTKNAVPGSVDMGLNNVIFAMFGFLSARV
jgi:hypothetical protein